MPTGRGKKCVPPNLLEKSFWLLEFGVKVFLELCCVIKMTRLYKHFYSKFKWPKWFFKQIRWYTFFSLYLWAKYELIWTNFTAQTVILKSNTLVQAQTIPQSANCSLLFRPKVAFTQDTLIFKRNKVLRCGSLAIAVKNVQFFWKIKIKPKIIRLRLSETFIIFC